MSHTIVSPRMSKCGTQPQTSFNQFRHMIQGNRIGAVAFGLVGLRVRFQKDAIATARHGCPREIGNHTAISAGAVTLRCRFLYAVSRVKDHGPAQILHHRNATEIVDELPIAEESTSFREE